MNDLTNDQLNEYLRDAEAALASLTERLDPFPQLHQAIASMLEAGEDAADSLDQLKADNPCVANRVMLASVAALANLRTAKAIRAELKRRAEGN